MEKELDRNNKLVSELVHSFIDTGWIRRNETSRTRTRIFWYVSSSYISNSYFINCRMMLIRITTIIPTQIEERLSKKDTKKIAKINPLTRMIEHVIK
jgi:predicted nucleic acid-binding Zn finger protein